MTDHKLRRRVAMKRWIATAGLALAVGGMALAGTQASAQPVDPVIDAQTLVITGTQHVQLQSPVTGKTVTVVRTTLVPKAAGARSASGGATTAAIPCAITVDDYAPSTSITGGTVYGSSFYTTSTTCKPIRFTHYLSENLSGKYAVKSDRSLVAQPGSNAVLDSINYPCWGTSGTSWKNYTSYTLGETTVIPCHS